MQLLALLLKIQWQKQSPAKSLASVTGAVGFFSLFHRGGTGSGCLFSCLEPSCCWGCLLLPGKAATRPS